PNLRKQTENERAALVSLLEKLQFPFVDRTGDAPFESVHELLSLWTVPGPLILIWDKYNASDPFTLDGATGFLRAGDLVSVSFDGSRPSFGFSRDLIDLSEWDGNPESAVVQPLILSLKKILDQHDIFVSYARADIVIAQRICAHLGSLNW